MSQNEKHSKPASEIEHKCWNCGHAWARVEERPGRFVKKIKWFICLNCGAEESFDGTMRATRDSANYM